MGWGTRSGRRGPTALAVGLIAVVAVGAFVLLQDDGRRPQRGVDPALTRGDGPSLLLDAPLRDAVGRLRDRRGDGHLVSLRLDGRRLTTTVIQGDRLVADTLRSNGLDRVTSGSHSGPATGPRVAEVGVDTLPRILAGVQTRSGRPREQVLFLTFQPAADAGSWSVTLADGERWTAAFDGSGIRRAVAGVADVDALRRCVARARTPAEQADCAR